MCFAYLSHAESSTHHILVPIVSHGLPGMSWSMILSLGCICWNSGHVKQIFTIFSISWTLIFTSIWTLQPKDIFFLFPCGSLRFCSKAYCWRGSGISILHFSVVPCITARSSENLQYGCISCLTSALFSGQLFIMNAVSTCKCCSMYYCQVIRESPIWLYFLSYLCFVQWPAIYNECCQYM